MKKSVIKVFDRIIVVLLGIAGMFSSCKKEMLPMYGVPHGEYALKGVVTDKKTSNPIPNIQVVRQRTSEYGDTIYTDANGKYAFVFGDFPYEENVYHLKIEDIDGEENGGDFKPQEIDVKITQDDQIEKGSGNWDKGKFLKTVNIKLERKE